MRVPVAFFVALASLLPAQVLAAFYDQSSEFIRLTSEVSYRIDKGSETNLEAVMSEREGWISQRSLPWAPTGKPVRLWARFEIPPSAEARRVFIVNGAWEREEYFFVRNDQVVAHEWAGSLLPASQRTTHVLTSNIGLSGFVSVIVPATAPTTVYVRIASDNRFIALSGLRFSLWSEQAVRDEEARDRVIQGVFFGILAVLVIYNLAIYFLDSRDPSYLYYVLGLVCIAAVWVTLSGFGFELLWPEHPEWDHYVSWIVFPVGMFAIANFVRGYLDTAKWMPDVDRQMRWVAVGVLMAPLVFVVLSAVSTRTDLQYAFRLGYIGVPIMGASAIAYVAIAALKRRLPFAGLFSAALGCAVVGVFLAGFAALGVWPSLIQAHQVGTALMGILLSVGMGFRMRDLRAELANRRIEEARIEAERRQHEIASKHKSEFLANISHELRTPLNAIIGFSEVMTSGMAGSLSDKQKEFAADIRDSGRHLLGLINDILDISKIEAGRMELDVARFNLRSAMENAMTLVRGRAERHGIQLETQIASEVGDYDGDERKFKQIMLNLLINAVKFTPEGGTVTMAAEKANESYVFSVKDTGIGIAPEDCEKVFEEFRQVGSDYARKAEGTGLGLTLTRKLVELHGGRIGVKSAVGLGSVFTFNLPVRTS